MHYIIIVYIFPDVKMFGVNSQIIKVRVYFKLIAVDIIIY